MTSEKMVDVDSSEILFDLNNPNKKFPKNTEIEPLIKLLELVKENIILLDPMESLFKI